MRNWNLKTVFSFLFFFLVAFSAHAQLPPSLCSASGGTSADIIDVQVAATKPGDPAPTFVLPQNALSATLTISSHNSIGNFPAANQFADEDFITITVLIDFVTKKTSGVLNYAQSTFTNSSGTSLFTWIDVPFGVYASTQYRQGQIAPALLNDIKVEFNSGVITVTQAKTNIYSTYLMEFMSPITNSLIPIGTGGLNFISGAITQSIAIPANADVMVINKKGTVRALNSSPTGGTEEGYADGRLIVDLDLNTIDGFMTVANGANIAYRSTYGIKDYPTNSTGNVANSGYVLGDYQNKSTLNTTNVAAIGISNPIINITGNTFTITREANYAATFDDVFVVEFYQRANAPMSASFIASRSAYIAKGQGTTTGTSRDFNIPTGSDFVIIRQAGNASNLDNEANENPLAGYYFVDLKTEKAAGFFWQQVGIDANSRRDDNYRFQNLPINGTSARNPTYSSGIYNINTTVTPNTVYDVSFTLSADKSKLTMTNKFGYVATEYKAIALASFYGKKTDLSPSVNITVFPNGDYNFLNNNTCSKFGIKFTVCNPGSGNSAGGFPVALYDKDPTQFGTARLLAVEYFATPIPSAQCQSVTFTLDYITMGLSQPNGTYYGVINDDGRNALGGIGTAIGTPFSLSDLEGQNANYIECDYTNNMVPMIVSGVMRCPTVDFQVTNSTNPTVTGSWDQINAQTNGLKVLANGVTYQLGSNPELVSPTAGNWSLNLTNKGLTSPNLYSLVATSTSSLGTAVDGTINELIITTGGFVFRDINGLSDNAVNGTILDTVNLQRLYVNVLNSTGRVIESSAVTNGKYTIATLANTTGTFSVQLTTIQGTTGQLQPNTVLSGDFVYSGEGPTGAIDANPDGIFTFTIPVANAIPVISFGIQRRPKSGGKDVPGVLVGNVVVGNQFNPGTFPDFEMPSLAFPGVDDGFVNGVRLTTFSSEIAYVQFGGIKFYKTLAEIPAGCTSPDCMVLPASGLLMTTTAAGALQQPLFLAMISNFVDGFATLSYQVRDNAGFFSANTNTIRVNFIALKYSTATGWRNGSDASGQPNANDGTKTLFWINNGGKLTTSAVVRNLIIYNGVTAEIEGACLTVKEEVENRGGKLSMKAISDVLYGQYLGPTVLADFQMLFEYGWHNVGIPTDATVQNLIDQNTDASHPNTIQVTGDFEKSNLQYYDTEISAGTEHGFYIQRSGTTYSSHAYGQFKLPLPTDLLRNRGYHLYFDDYFYPTQPVPIKISGNTNDQSQTFDTHNNFGGWNLIPNIYPVSLSTNKMYIDGFFGYGENQFDKAIFIWNPNDPHTQTVAGKTKQGAYLAFDPENGVVINQALGQTVEGDVLIAPFQSFYVRRTSASTTRRQDVGGIKNPALNPAVSAGSLIDPALPTTGAGMASVQTVTIKPSYRSACQSVTNYKTDGAIADIILLQVADETNGLTDAIELAFADHYTDGIDASYDVQKFAAGGDKFPSIFSIVDGEALVINKMAIPDLTKSIPVGFVSAQKNNHFSISIQRNKKLYNLYLEDKLTGAWHNLNDGEYHFSNNLDFQINRFVLHFNTGNKPIEKGKKIVAYSKDDNLNSRSLKTIQHTVIQYYMLIKV